MFIKEVNITGFRSYRETTTINDFSSRHNVVVGRNGSGKSNFFVAIQFVLGSDFSSLSQQERLGLLHESVGGRSLVAKVEIVFDNTDRRIPSDSNEVRIMRQVTPKKDNYYIDNKNAQRSDVVNLMESAGFSRSNPYYIVKQGKITELATASETYLLKLIREVAGTRVFDEKKEESNKILAETQIKIKKSESLLNYIEERLRKLEQETQHLKEYQSLDGTKRAVEYTIYKNESSEAENKCAKFSSQREEINSKQNEVETNLISINEDMNRIESSIRKLDSQYKGTKEEHQAILNEQSECQEQKTNLELLIKDLRDDVDKERKGKDEAEEILGNLKREIVAKQDELEMLKPEYLKLVEQENAFISEIRISEQECKEIFAKQGYRDRFKTKEERDRHLRKELNFLDKQKNKMTTQISEIEKSMKDDVKEHEKLNSYLTRLTTTLQEKSSTMYALSQQLQTKKVELDKAIKLKMESAREERKLKDGLNTIEYDISAAEQELRRLSSKAIMKGINSVQVVLSELQDDPQCADILNGYHGCVIDLFKCQPEHNKAIEVTAEGRLFYHVVDDDRIAMKILSRINEKELPGEVNFYPLNRVVGKARRTVIDRDAIYMLDSMEYDATKYDSVFRSIFRDAVFVRDMVAGQRVSKQERFDCVTLEGDQVSRRGPMTGGYIDSKKSKIEHSHRLRELKERHKCLAEQLEKVTLNLNEHSKNADKVRNECNKLEMDTCVLSQDHQQILEKKRLLSEQDSRISMEKEPKESQKLQLKGRLKEIDARIDLINSEMGTELHSQLSPGERERADTIHDEIKEKKSKLTEVMKRRSTIENQIEKIKNELQSSLLRRKENLSATVESNIVNEKDHKLTMLHSELTRANTSIKEILRKINVLSETMDDYEEQRGKLAATFEDNQEQKKAFEAEKEELEKKADIYCTKIATFQNKRDECIKKIKEIGSLRTDILGSYASWSMKRLDAKLTECTNRLKNYENVNKKAMDQFVRATGQKEELVKRVNDLKKNEESISNLLNVLNERRHETLHLTIKQVAKNFQEVFNKLIPQGSGTLVILSMSDSSLDTTGSTVSRTTIERQQHPVETFRGVGIKVSFTGSALPEDCNLSSLSGGQKSLVALALIFAIQKCDPAPFYLFDEIDAALDREHRKAVADMIHELSENAQFITTTFRAELLQHAEKFYGVRCRNKVSDIFNIPSEQAYDFIQDDQTHS